MARACVNSVEFRPAALAMKFRAASSCRAVSSDFSIVASASAYAFCFAGSFASAARIRFSSASFFAITAGSCSPLSWPRWFLRLFWMPNRSLVDWRSFSALRAIHFLVVASRISLLAIANASVESRRYLKWASVFRR